MFEAVCAKGHHVPLILLVWSRVERLQAVALKVLKQGVSSTDVVLTSKVVTVVCCGTKHN